MKKLIAFVVTSLGIGCSTFVLAQTTYELGSVMLPTQISAFGAMKTFTVANKVFRILPSTHGDGGFVINDHGKVGKCHGDVLISGVSVDQAKKALDPYQSKIASLKVYDSLRIVSARFNDLESAAKARNELAESIAGATVTLPIVFSLPKAR